MIEAISRLWATSSNLGMELTVDYHTELYPLKVGEKFTLVLASSLVRGADPAEGKAEWRPDGKGQQGLDEDYEYVMHGLIYKFEGGEVENAPLALESRLFFQVCYITFASHEPSAGRRVKGTVVKQRELQKKAIFDDHDLSFHVAPPKSIVPPGEPDHDEPIVRNEDPKAFTVSGLKYVGGLDISFVTQEEDTGEHVGHNASDPSVPDAYAVITVLEYPTLVLLHSITLPIRLTAPYIPSFLSYRETPAYLELISALREYLHKAGKEHEFPQVILVDGNGQLHVREAGVATAVGVESNIPTIGVAKTYHPPIIHEASDADCDLDEQQPSQSHWRLSQKGMKQKSRMVLKQPGDYLGIWNERGDRYVGVTLRSPTSTNFLYVSSGHRVSLVQAIRLTMALSKHRIPEPIRLADKLGREAAAATTETGKAMS
ncbi:RNA polymerase rpb8 domain-containing protein [Ceratobasidium theobromae]|uniref:RNA polymerase rpb8 domain-containing protein n=1 Tax=Ceratobasidium theobromae TaxID=1582974 RepID=A0A5N5QGC4_9AGAM|nr:RNA polymerase rpb8 domain-containing protein [Ceratobasidium theobromae]